MEYLESILAIAFQAGTAVTFAALGGIVTERAGVINLAIEGVLMLSAMVAVAATLATGSLILGVIAAAMAGAGLMFLHALACVTIRTNQVVTGLAIVFLGSGLAELFGKPIVGQIPPEMLKLNLPLLSEIPILRSLAVDQDLLTVSLVAVLPLAWWFIYKTKPGVNLRAVGENPQAANALGVNVMATRYLYCIIGGLLIGVGGAHLSLSYTPGWSDNITAGRGWIAVAIVIFSFWHPLRAILGVMLFGIVVALKFRLQAAGDAFMSGYFMDMMPYVATILALVLMSAMKKEGSGWAPASLGQPYYRE